MLNRRDFLFGIGCAVAGLTGSISIAGQDTPKPRLPRGIGVTPDFNGPLPEPGTLGTVPALAAEVKVAQAVLDKAPAGPIPLAVAKYFQAVGKGEFGAEWQLYVKGWPVRWNPVIVTSFTPLIRSRRAM